MHRRIIERLLRIVREITVSLSPFAPRKQRCFRGAKGDTNSSNDPNSSHFHFSGRRFAHTVAVGGASRVGNEKFGEQPKGESLTTEE